MKSQSVPNSQLKHMEDQWAFHKVPSYGNKMKQQQN